MSQRMLYCKYHCSEMYDCPFNIKGLSLQKQNDFLSIFFTSRFKNCNEIITGLHFSPVAILFLFLFFVRLGCLKSYRSLNFFCIMLQNIFERVLAFVKLCIFFSEICK